VSVQEPVVVTDFGDVLVIKLNRPHVRNAMNLGAATALAAALDRLDADEGLRCGVLLSVGPVFCAGMDLKAVAAGEPRPITPDRGGLGIVGKGPDKPLVAAVQGPALGGGLEVALACDVIIASDDASFGLPEVKRGQVAAGGGVVRLPRRLPFHVAAEMLLTGDPISAERAATLGLVSAVVARAELADRAVATARRIAANAPLAVRATKELMYSTLDWPAALALSMQEPIVDPIRRSKDAAEGARAFAEKRPPVWLGE
jgi:enoyl-CoA hydratase